MERDWLIPFAMLATLEWACAQALAWMIGYPSTPSYISHFAFMAIIGLGAIFCFYAFHFFRMMFRNAPAPAKALYHLTRDNLARFSTIGLGLAFTGLHIVSFNWSKAMLPLVIPFWADPALADFDEAIFGTAAWKWAHQLAGNTSILFYWAYALWPALQLTFALALIFSGPSLRKSRLLIAYLLTWVIGGALSFALSSAGPLFYRPLGFGDRFNDLISQPHLERFPETAHYLWLNYQGLSALPAGGISAFPSMHVAVAVWIALVVRHWAGWLYAAMITFGSILFGWHYVLDAPAGAAVALLAYWLARRIRRRQESEAPIPSPVGITAARSV